MEQVIISIGREYGSAGHEIAQRLAEHYNLKLYDKNLLKEIAEEKNLNHQELEEFDEKFRNKFLYRKVRNMNSSPEDNVAQIQFNYLKDKAKSGESFVVVGRCSETVLKDFPALISIFITGDMDCKLKRIERLYHLKGREARNFILENNTKRKLYHNSHCKNTWGDSRNYDLLMNSSKLGLEGSVDMLIKYIDARRSHPETEC